MKTNSKQSKKKRRNPFLRIMAIILALGIVVFLICTANSFLGNPVSAWIAENQAKKWMETNHPDQAEAFDLSKASWNFKFGEYTVTAAGKENPYDTFTISISPWGTILSDTYNTLDTGEARADSVYRDYDDLIRTLLNPNENHLPTSFTWNEYEIDNTIGSLNFADPQNPDPADGTLSYSDLLEMDAISIEEIGRQYGIVQFVLTNLPADRDTLARALLDMKAFLQEKQVPAHNISVSIYSSNEFPMDSIDVSRIPLEQITPEQVEAAIEENLAAEEAWIQENQWKEEWLKQTGNEEGDPVS